MPHVRRSTVRARVGSVAADIFLVGGGEERFDVQKVVLRIVRTSAAAMSGSFRQCLSQVVRRRADQRWSERRGTLGIGPVADRTALRRVAEQLRSGFGVGTRFGTIGVRIVGVGQVERKIAEPAGCVPVRADVVTPSARTARALRHAGKQSQAQQRPRQYREPFDWMAIQQRFLPAEDNTS